MNDPDRKSVFVPDLRDDPELHAVDEDQTCPPAPLGFCGPQLSSMVDRGSRRC
jgi:hypothetical protein